VQEREMLNKNILIIDDEKDVAVTTEDFFTDQGCNVSVALTAEEAMKSLELKNQELIVLDMKMPDLDGASLLKMINEKYPDAKVIILTGHGEEYKSKVEDLRYDAFLTKPFSTFRLIEAAKEILEGRELSKKEESLYNDPHVMPQARLLFIEPNALYASGKRVYFSSMEKCGAKYEIDILLETENVEEKLDEFKPDIIIGDLLLLGSATELRSKIMNSKFRPKDIIVYGGGVDYKQDKKDSKFVEGYFDPLTSVFSRDIMDRLGKIVREASINNSLYVKVEAPVKVPGLSLKKEDSPSPKTEAEEEKKEIEFKDIPSLVRAVIAKRLGIAEAVINDRSHFVNDFGMDSLASIEIVMDLEERLGLEIPDHDVARLQKFKQVVEYLEKRHCEKDA